ncbi:MAG: Fe-S cluster assembly scaffold protein NifU [Candidatus Norongarragalinales archaeon]
MVEETRGKGIYSEKVMNLFLHPHNAGEIEDADGVGVVGNPVCGDLMRIYIKVKDGRIEDIKFQTFGCAAAIATSSMITDLAKGKTLEDALKITRNDVVGALERLPPIKMHCSNLAADGLHEAIYDYYKKSGKLVPPELEREHERINRATTREREESEASEARER